MLCACGCLTPKAYSYLHDQYILMYQIVKPLRGYIGLLVYIACMVAKMHCEGLDRTLRHSMGQGAPL